MLIEMNSLLIENFVNYELSKVRVKVLKDYKQIEFDGRKFGPFKKDAYVEIPRALARVLSSEYIVEYPPPQISISDLKKILFYESKNKDLKKLEEDFYLQVKDLLYLSENKKLDFDPKEIKNILHDICNKRVEKILQIILRIEDYRKILPLLSNEEKFLVMKLNEVLKEWFENVLNNSYLRKV
jgi:GINS complex subunit Sld5.